MRLGAAAAVCILALAANPSLAAHGGVYRPPPDPPPERPPPSTPRPPPTRPGTGRPPPAPKTSPGTPVPSGPATAPGRGPTTGGGRRARRTTGEASWRTWWELNRDPYLRAVRSAFVQTGPPAKDAPLRPTDRERVALVVPALAKAAAGDDPNLLDSAAIAIGRAVPRGAASAFLEDLERLLRCRAPSVRQSALLAFGLLGHRKATPLLWSVLVDSGAGRRALGSRSTPGVVDRAFAAIALGLLGDPAAADLLLREVGRDASPIEVRAAAALALGCMRDQAREIVSALAPLLQDERLDPRLRAVLPVTCARLGDAGRRVLPTLLRLAGARRTEEGLRRSAFLALGRLAVPDDAEAARVLLRAARRAQDAASRGFALVALGGVLERALGADPSDATALALLDDLEERARDPAKTLDLPFAVLALGRAVTALPAGSTTRRDAGRTLARLFRRRRNPDEAGALALALGLAHERSVVDSLRDRFAAASEPRLRAELGLALALLGDLESRAPLRKVLLEERDPHLRAETAVALSLLHDGRAADALVEALARARTFAEASSLARALGRIGDRRHVAPAAALVVDASRSEVLRGFACVALGRIAERSSQTWYEPFHQDANFLLPLAFQTELLDIY